MNDTVKIAVMVSGGGTNLQALLDAQSAGKIKSGRISLVISNKAGVYALERARRAGVPAVTILKKDFENAQAFEAEMVKTLEENGIGLIILAGFLYIFSERFTKRYPKRIINVHPALIPSFCGKGFYGLKVHEAALEYGVKVTGATVHFVSEIPDGGEIIDQKAVRVLQNDTPETLQLRVMQQAEWILLPRAAEKVSAKIRKEGENYERV